MIYVSIKEKRGENVRCKIQARIGKERTNHVARFDLFLEFSFFLLTFFLAILFIFLGHSQSSLRLCCSQCAIVEPLRILCLL